MNQSLSMKVLLVLVIMILSAEHSYSSIRNMNHEIDTVYSYSDVDVKPIPVKGIEALYKKWRGIAKYPIEAKRKRIQGKVYVSFTVDETGNLIDLKVEQGIGHGCDEAAIKALSEIDLEWQPGVKNGEKVKVRMFLPFTFKLD